MVGLFKKEEEKIPTIRDWLEKAGFSGEGRIILRGKEKGSFADRPVEYDSATEVDWDDLVLDSELLVCEFKGVPQPNVQFIAEDEKYRYLPQYFWNEGGCFRIASFEVAGIARIPKEGLDTYLAHPDEDIPYQLF